MDGKDYLVECWNDDSRAWEIISRPFNYEEAEQFFNLNVVVQPSGHHRIVRVVMTS